MRIQYGTRTVQVLYLLGGVQYNQLVMVVVMAVVTVVVMDDSHVPTVQYCTYNRYSLVC